MGLHQHTWINAGEALIRYCRDCGLSEKVAVPSGLDVERLRVMAAETFWRAEDGAALDRMWGRPHTDIETMSGRAIFDKAMAGPTQELTITAQALRMAIPAIEIEAETRLIRALRAALAGEGLRHAEPSRTLGNWAEKRQAIAARWTGPGKEPMTAFEMAAAVERDRLWTHTDLEPDEMAAYDRRGLLNVVAALLDERGAA